MVAITLCGCTAAGKTTLAMALCHHIPDLAVVHADSHKLPDEQCGPIDLQSLPWPRGMPRAFRARGNADLNVPHSIRWQHVEQEVEYALQSHANVIVEGHLLFSAHPGAARVRQLCSQHVLLHAHEQAKSTLCRRKWTRSHLGKPSYRSQGVASDEYAVYWNHYVWPRWIDHSQCLPSDALRLDCLQPTTDIVDHLLDVEWLSAI